MHRRPAIDVPSTHTRPVVGPTLTYRSPSSTHRRPIMVASTPRSDGGEVCSIMRYLFLLTQRRQQ
eukprot:7292416-Lingulodinium_polyedra.AAC.1